MNEFMRMNWQTLVSVRYIKAGMDNSETRASSRVNRKSVDISKSSIAVHFFNQIGKQSNKGLRL